MESLVIDTLHWRHMFLVLATPIGLWLYESREGAEVVETEGPPEPEPLASVPSPGGSE